MFHTHPSVPKRLTARAAQAGFTAVELLVTLFVAAAFLIAGYQLFNVVMQDGGETRAQVAAANVAYSYLRQYSDSATNPCTPTNPVVNEGITVDTLKNVRVSVSIECTQSDAPSLSKVTVIIHYNMPQKTLTYSTYVDKSTGASAQVEVLSGLVGWWRLNGNVDASTGTSNGTINGSPSSATGQSGASNTAYSFGPTCCSYISASNLPALPVTGTFSAWVYPTAYPSERAAIIVTTPTSGTVNAAFMSLNSDGSLQAYRYGATSPGYHSAGAGSVPLNQWTLVTVVWEATQVKLYTNGSLRATVASTSALTPSYGINIGAESASNLRQFTGRIDDVRIYNRSLSLSEIGQLFNGGAK